jgi:LCP family protein required for cell wall assembly
VVIDDDAKKIYQIAIDRDTMTPIRILGILGDVSSTRTEHLSLSHAFGDGKEQSCEFTVEAVTNLLFGLPIDHYFALNMDGISELNDWLGGVTVYVEDDFSQVDPTIVQGENVTLHGDQAEIFVRERKSMNVGTNEGRMARQKLYLQSAQDILRAKLAGDMDAAENFYDSLNLYFTTDMSKGTLSNIAYSTNEYEALEAVQPEGEHMINDDGFMEFHVDEQSLLRTIVETFYDKVE